MIIHSTNSVQLCSVPLGFTSTVSSLTLRREMNASTFNERFDGFFSPFSGLENMQYFDNWQLRRSEVANWQLFTITSLKKINCNILPVSVHLKYMQIQNFNLYEKPEDSYM